MHGKATEPEDDVVVVDLTSPPAVAMASSTQNRKKGAEVVKKIVNLRKRK